MKNQRIISVLYALLAAVFYALNMPLSKCLLERIQPMFLASFLYLGAGVGIGIIYLFSDQKNAGDKLTKRDLPYTLGMIVLDIAAPILLMLGLKTAAASSASLLNNFEIVATALIALLLFRERITLRLWGGIILITAASVLLSVEDESSFSFSGGSLLILAAACCWGLENNCTRQISERNSYEIVTIKGVCSGLGSLVIAFAAGEQLPAPLPILGAMLLGFIAYGLSISFYIRAQKGLGAAKTSAYYAVAPFAGAALSFLVLRESFSRYYLAALIIMLAGSVLVLVDTLLLHHQHLHTHVITHTHDGSTHTHTFTHEHGHAHVLNDELHGHRHTPEEIHGNAGN